MGFRKNNLLLLAACLLSVAGCKVGPKYERPEMNLGNTYRFSPSSDTNSFANLKWVSIFQDTVLQNLVRRGLDSNYDVRIAYARIDQAMASFKMARGDQWPAFGAVAEASYNRQPFAGKGSTEYAYYAAAATLSWEIDIWGKLRRAKESERAKLFATQAYQQSVRINLIADIITNYFDLLNLDDELAITYENISIREKSLELVRAKMIAGTASGLVVAQAEAALATARTQVPFLQMQIGMKENAICILLGETPHSIPRGMPLLEQILDPSVRTPGVPSQLIVRRPDIIQAEEQLISANADIGVARAYMLPALSISGDIGASFSPTTMLYNAIGNLVAPIFNGGKLRANWKRSIAVKQEMLYNYQQTIINAMREVSDGIILFQKQKEIVVSQDSTVAANQTTFDLSNQLYFAGYASYLDVLDAQRSLFDSQITLSLDRSNALVSVVNLYRALGGGWQ